MLRQEIYLHRDVSRKKTSSPVPNVTFIHNFLSVTTGLLQTNQKIVFLELRRKLYFMLATKIF